MSVQLAQSQQNQPRFKLFIACTASSVGVLVALCRPPFGSYLSLHFNVSIWPLMVCLPQVCWLRMLLFLLTGLASEGLLGSQVSKLLTIYPPAFRPRIQPTPGLTVSDYFFLCLCASLVVFPRGLLMMLGRVCEEPGQIGGH